jgi:hypothetical protein
MMASVIHKNAWLHHPVRNVCAEVVVRVAVVMFAVRIIE